jgi:hypothetical protein
VSAKETHSHWLLIAILLTAEERYPVSHTNIVKLKPNAPLKNDHRNNKMSGICGNKEQTYIASVVATYWFVSISMVYLNKALMSSDMSIPALFVTWFQCVITAARYVVGGG